MFLFDLKLIRPQAGSREFGEALSQAKKEYRLGDMSSVEKLVTAQNAYLGVYTDPRGRTYHRLLLKNEEGKFFDYRMNGKPGEKKAWVSEPEWKRRLGLGEGFAVSIVKLELPGGGHPSRGESLASGFLTTVEAESTSRRRSEQTIYNKITEKGPPLVLPITSIPPAGDKIPVARKKTPLPPKGPQKKSTNPFVLGLERNIENYYIDKRVIVGLQREDNLFDSEKPKVFSGSKYRRVEKADGGFTVTKTKFGSEIVVGFTGLFERLVQARQGEARLIDLIGKYSEIYGVDFNLACALFATESLAVKDAASVSGCLGLGQLSRKTAAGLLDKDGKKIFASKRVEVLEDGAKKLVLLANKNEVLNAEKNVEGSIVYLKEKLEQCKGNAALALAAYNSGLGSVQQFERTGEFMKERGNDPEEYALRCSQFAQFFSDIGLVALLNTGLPEFLASEQYQKGYGRLKEYAVRGKEGFKRGYIADAGSRAPG